MKLFGNIIIVLFLYRQSFAVWCLPLSGSKFKLWRSNFVWNDSNLAIHSNLAIFWVICAPNTFESRSYSNLAASNLAIKIDIIIQQFQMGFENIRISRLFESRGFESRGFLCITEWYNIKKAIAYLAKYTELDLCSPVRQALPLDIVDHVLGH